MKNKAIISLLAILAIILGVFAYLLSTKSLVSENNYQTELDKVETVSDSDEIEAIETDLNDTELENIDAEIIQIETELDAALDEL